MKKPIETRIIRKYQNRRLYDTATSSYIVLDEIKQMITDGETIQVIDVKTNNDVTQSVLLQIILDQEVNNNPIFTNDFLVQIIRFYGKAFQPAISPFLEQGIDMLRQSQKRFYTQLKATYPKESIPDLWNEFWAKQGPHIQQNIFDYLSSSTNNFLQMQEHVNEQLQNQTENFMSMLKFPFNNNKESK